MNDRDKALCRFGHGTAEQYPTDALRYFMSYADRPGTEACVSCTNAAEFVVKRREADQAANTWQLDLLARPWAYDEADDRVEVFSGDCDGCPVPTGGCPGTCPTRGERR